jgi:hypothetical protein
MAFVEGDRFKHKIDGQFYKVKIIKNGTFVLESEDTPNRTWIGDGDLDLFFEIVEETKNRTRNLGRR